MGAPAFKKNRPECTAVYGDDMENQIDRGGGDMSDELMERIIDVRV